MELDTSTTTISDMSTKVPDYSVESVTIDAAGAQKETTWSNTKWNDYIGYYKKIPEYKTALNAFATWVVGKGWKADARTTALLENITGWGEDTFMSILWNLLVVKKVAGDAYAEIIRNSETGTLINFKPLNNGRMTHVVNPQGLIERYDYRQPDGKIRKLKPQQVLHLVNDRVADEIHGTSVTESVEWVILARNEAMADWKRLSHRSTVRVMYIDVDNTTRLTHIKTQYAEAIKKGELMLIPAKKGEAELVDFTLPPIDNFLGWIKYLENFFYQALGIPKVILGGSEEFTEASSKIGYLTYEQVYTREVEELIADLWNQVAIRIDFWRPASIKNELLQSEGKNTGQVGFQPKEAAATMERE